jgi:hypothetical protein
MSVFAEADFSGLLLIVPDHALIAANVNEQLRVSAFRGAFWVSPSS